MISGNKRTYFCLIVTLLAGRLLVNSADDRCSWSFRSAPHVVLIDHGAGKDQQQLQRWFDPAEAMSQKKEKNVFLQMKQSKDKNFSRVYFNAVYIVLFTEILTFFYFTLITFVTLCSNPEQSLSRMFSLAAKHARSGRVIVSRRLHL